MIAVVGIGKSMGPVGVVLLKVQPAPQLECACCVGRSREDAESPSEVIARVG